jgi:predicted nucleic acid-binding protein
LKIYADPSFLVSLYIPDANSYAALRTMQSSSGVRFVTAFSELEVVNAFGLRVFRKQASPEQAKSASANFEKDLREGLFEVRWLPETFFGRAKELSTQTTTKLGTRTADLLHVAAALELEADYLFSFDQQQRKLAQSLRLKLN